MKVNGKDDIPYMKWKITAMFETTKQYIHLYVICHTWLLFSLFQHSLNVAYWIIPG